MVPWWIPGEFSAWDSTSNFGCGYRRRFEAGNKVDVFVPKLRRFEVGQFSRAKRIPLTEGSAIEIPICSPEDIVIAKLEWYRAGGELSERQWGDILGVLRVNSTQLDFGTMQASANELGVTDLMVKALAEAGLS